MMASPPITTIDNGYNPLSNFAYTPFIVDGILYYTAEQFVQVQKARTFGAHALVSGLINTRSPPKCRQLGADVDVIDPVKWNDKVDEVMRMCLREKFTQNVAARKALLAAKGTVIALADRYDSVWGTGLDYRDERFGDRQYWGQDRLGQLLMQICDEI